MVNTYTLKTRDFEHDYKSFNGSTRFNFSYLNSVIDNEVNNTRGWFVECGGKVLNAYNFTCLRLNGETEDEIFARFA